MSDQVIALIFTLIMWVEAGLSVGVFILDAIFPLGAFMRDLLRELIMHQILFG